MQNSISHTFLHKNFIISHEEDQSIYPQTVQISDVVKAYESIRAQQEFFDSPRPNNQSDGEKKVFTLGKDDKKELKIGRDSLGRKTPAFCDRGKSGEKRNLLCCSDWSNNIIGDAKKQDNEIFTIKEDNQLEQRGTGILDKQYYISKNAYTNENTSPFPQLQSNKVKQLEKIKENQEKKQNNEIIQECSLRVEFNSDISSIPPDQNILFQFDQNRDDLVNKCIERSKNLMTQFENKQALKQQKEIIKAQQKILKEQRKKQKREISEKMQCALLRSQQIINKLTSPQLQQIECQDFIFVGSLDSKGQKNGYGVLRSKITEVVVYLGEWRDNKFNGDGVLHNICEQSLKEPFSYVNFNFLNQYWKYYEGQFENGLMHGQGTLILSNFEKYSGQFHEGKINGQGIFSRKDGKKIIGEWKDGILKNE